MSTPTRSSRRASERTPTAGLHPPDSVAWRVNAERLAVLAWPRAILLQFAHPLVAAGVFAHSGFRTTPLAAVARLAHTVRAMLSLTFGTDADRARTLDAIRAVHRRVHGTLPEAVGRFAAGTRYSAEDPALVLWVHVTLVESVILGYEQLVAPLSVPERDAYCEDAAGVAVALGATAPDVPRTWSAIQCALARGYASDAIVVGREARLLAEAVLHPKGLRAAGPAVHVVRTITLGTLPPAIRAQYGWPWSDRDEQRLERIVRATRAIRRWTPAVVAQW